jgi:hypothetical protein
MTTQIKCPHCKTPLAFENTQRFEPTACPRCKGPFVPVHVQLKEGRIELGGMVKRFRWVLWVAFLSLPLLFGWLKFQDADFVNAGKQLEVGLLLKLSMALYYLSWSLGAGWETSDMESFYAVPPNRGRLPWGTFVAIGFLVGAGAILCFVHSLKWFAPALAGFWVLDYLGWIYLGVVVRPTVADSCNLYEESKKYDKLENLLVFDELNQGAWKWWRGGTGVVLLVFINVLAFSRLSQILGEAVGGMPHEVVLALSILSYILVVESWIWFKRIEALNGYRLIANLSEKYDLSPKTRLSLTPPSPEPVVVQATPCCPVEGPLSPQGKVSVDGSTKPSRV